MKPGTFHIISLGCAKNLVDSRSMAELLDREGFQENKKVNEAQVIVVNTCGFIAPARQESTHELQKLIRRKKTGQYIIAAGCLPQWQGPTLMQQIPGIDATLSTRDWINVPIIVRELGVQALTEKRGTKVGSQYNFHENPISRAAVQGRSAYLKIADGCRRACAFCSIPLIKGAAVSRTLEEIVRDACLLQQQGIQEINLIAQDTTDYGFDLGMKDGLSTLLLRLIKKTPSIPWIRIMYAFPGFVTIHLIDIMAGNQQILHYLDMPLQHAHPEILLRMNRPANMDWVRRTIANMRSAMPDLAIRSTFIVGFPGETDKHFLTLLDFLKEMQFDRIGVFPYSFEPGTPAEALGDPISEKEKQRRVEQFMLTQQEISLKKNEALIGKKLDILVEGRQDEFAIGRSYRDAPEIDGLVFASGQAEIGEMVPVLITNALIHDLSGKIDSNDAT